MEASLNSGKSLSVRKAFFWSFLGQVISFVAVFGTTIALSRILSPREIGVYAIGLAVAGVLQGLAAFGVGNYLVRDTALARSTVATAFSLNLLISLALAAAIAACSFAGAVTMGETQIAAILRMLALTPLISVLEFMPATLLQREMNFSAISLVTIARTLASALVSIAAALLGASALSAAYGALAYAVAGAIGFNLVARRHAIFRLSLEGWREMTGFGLKTMSIGGVSMISMRLSDVILGRNLGLAALGFYSRASALSNAIFQNIYGSAARVLFAKLAEDDRRGVPLRLGYLKALDIILALLWPLLACLAVLARPAVTFLFGDRWLPAADPLSVLMIALMLGLSFAMHSELFVLRDRVGEQSRLEIVRTAIGLAAFAYGCTFGLVGAAAARVVDSVVGMILYMPRLSVLSGASSREIVILLLRNLCIAISAAAPAAALMIQTGWRPGVSLYALIGVVTAGGVCWLLALMAFSHPLYFEIRNWLGGVVSLRRNRRGN